MKKIKEIILFANGNTIVFDEDGEQIGEAQCSWLRLYIEFLVSKGVNPDGMKMLMPNNREVSIHMTKQGYNWSFNEQ